MHDQPDFEGRLAVALRRRADAAPIAVDAHAVTLAAASARTTLGARLLGKSRWRTARLVLAVALLVAIVVVGLIIAGRLVWPAPRPSLGRLVPAGEMTTARGGPTATLLQDGRVLLAGGQVNGEDQGSAELYDPTTGRFTRTGSLSTLFRVWAASALLPDGRVLVVGGYGQTPDSEEPITLPFGEIYDPATGTFDRTGRMIRPRDRLQTVVSLPDGRVLIVGGDDGKGTVELFDPATDMFTEGGTLLTPRDSPSLTLLQDGRVLVAGGYTDGPPVTTAEIYDPTTGTSVPTGDLREPRYRHGASLLADGRVLIAGGSAPGPDYDGALASAELYDTATGTFVPTGSMITERSGARVVTLDDGRVLVAGGSNVDGDPRTIELYDPASGAFSVAGSLAPAQESGNPDWLSATLLKDGSVLLAGRDIATTERFVPTLPAEPNATATFPAEPVGFAALDAPDLLRTGHTATRLPDGRVLIAGGRLGASGPPLTSAEVFDPVTGAVTQTGSMVTPRTDHVAALLPDGRVLIAGGLDDRFVRTSRPSAELYDPASGTFSPHGTMTVATQPSPIRSVYPGRPAAALLPDGRVLVIGWDPTNARTKRSMVLFDPATDQLTTLELPAEALQGGLQAMAIVPDGRVLILDVDDHALQAEVYDPLADAWELGATTIPREAFATAVLSDGQVLISGGGPPHDDRSMSTAETWDPVSGGFSSAGGMGAGRTAGTATLLPDGRVLIAGGVDQQYIADRTGSSIEYPAPQLWDPATRTFSPAGVMAAQRSGHTATMLDDGRVLLIGGVLRSPDRNEASPPAAELYGKDR